VPQVTAKLTAELLVARAPLDGACGHNTGDPATAYHPTILAANTAITGADAGQKLMTVNSPAAFVAFAFPANLRGRVVYFRPLSGTFVAVRLTHAGQGATVYPVNGMLLSEYPEAEQVSVVEVKGEGSFEWASWGVLV